jgi:hypothetical protein
MHDDAALDASAILISGIRELFPGRCFAQRAVARPGQIWIDDQTGRPPYTSTRLWVKWPNVGVSRVLALITITGERTIRVSIPYKDLKMIRSMTALPVRRRSERIAFDDVDASTARDVAVVIARLVKLGFIRIPPLARADVLDMWRIV